MYATFLSRGPAAEPSTRPRRLPAASSCRPGRPGNHLRHARGHLRDQYATFWDSPASASRTEGPTSRTTRASRRLRHPRAAARRFGRVDGTRASRLEKYATKWDLDRKRSRSGRRYGRREGEEVAYFTARWSRKGDRPRPRPRGGPAAWPGRASASAARAARRGGAPAPCRPGPPRRRHRPAPSAPRIA